MRYLSQQNAYWSSIYSSCERGRYREKGDLIAKIPDTALGANIHASIDGQIIRITEEQVHIKKVMS